MAPRRLICAAYLTSRPDPQRHRRLARDSVAYMRRWYASVRALGLHAVVFHDELSPAFVARLTTPRIRFRRVPPSPWSPNDARFFAYQAFLRRHPARQVFLTDIADVTVVRDPFAGMRAFRTPLFVGTEVYPVPVGRTIRRHTWLMGKIAETRGPRSSEVGDFFAARGYHLPTLNAGVVGGAAPTVRRFLAHVTRVRRAIGHPERNLNMPIVNYVLHRYFAGRFHPGAPVTSVFKAYERHRTDVWFVHK
jgi:hypothetical protein